MSGFTVRFLFMYNTGYGKRGSQRDKKTPQASHNTGAFISVRYRLLHEYQPRSTTVATSSLAISIHFYRLVFVNFAHLPINRGKKCFFGISGDRCIWGIVICSWLAPSTHGQRYDYQSGSNLFIDLVCDSYHRQASWIASR